MNNKIGQTELNQWMVQTIHYATVCAGTDEIEQEKIHDIVRGVVATLTAKPSMNDVVTAILQKATTILGPEKAQHNESIEPQYLTNVIKWTLLTVAAIWSASGKQYQKELLEAVADDKIVSGIQGNRQHPTRHDLDLIVRKTIEWGRADLEASSTISP